MTHCLRLTWHSDKSISMCSDDRCDKEIIVALTAYILLFVTATFYFWKTFPAACGRARSQSWKICCFSHSLQPNLPTTNYAIQIGRNNTRKHVLNTGFIIWFHYNNLISDLSYFRVLENSLKMFFSAVFYNLLTFSSYTSHGNLFKSINRKDEREKMDTLTPVHLEPDNEI